MAEEVVATTTETEAERIERMRTEIEEYDSQREAEARTDADNEFADVKSFAENGNLANLVEDAKRLRVKHVEHSTLSSLLENFVKTVGLINDNIERAWTQHVRDYQPAEEDTTATP